MELKDQNLIAYLSETNPEIRKLYKKHLKLNKEVARYGRYAIYSASAALRTQELKREKLKIKEDLLHIVQEYRDKEERREAA